jgi:hypothetical protein
MLTVMAWQLRCKAVFEEMKRDDQYWDRWQAAFAKIR